ncbi:unnamed protein product [Didymodactylos carnosus]|uniref:Transposase n=1 Tax=Didymodactylos carnosus TaxID=1234261 RepID=A0A814S3S7_9BILA|nr:unnamed protein product [Didymodactylos carnosus]CAF1141000.1 unnamed protein product [Didymodactylos carnosus]CAF3693912.1 unnamed protein product [Didymodactylos carnosus]CAF3904707.1 unnamed protein product [Didymodactylos carnosus]
MCLSRKINRILQRRTIKNRSRCGAPRTVRTEQSKKKVKQLLHLKKRQSQRKVVFGLQRHNIKGKRTSVQRTIKELNLKPIKLKKAQKLTTLNTQQRVSCAKKLIQKFGPRKNGQKWQWNKIINTDFSGILTIEGFRNNENDVIYAEHSSEIPADLREASVVKFPSGVMFLGAISTKGLIPQSCPFNFTQWLQDQCPLDKRKRIYMIGDLYAEFLREEAVPAINEVVKNLDEVIFQDDQDSKHRTKVAMDVVYDHFEERIEPNDGDATFADVWPIKSIWGILKEKTRGKKFQTLDLLVDFINSEWQKITPDQCEAMLDNVPKRLAKVVQLDGNQVYEH